MDAATLQSKVDKGYGKAGAYLGYPCDVFRPSDPLDPMSAPILTGPTAVNAVFAQNSNFSKFNRYGNAVWVGMFDGSLVRPGDYLVGQDGTFFVGAEQHLLPYLCVQCNRTLTISRPTQDDANVGFTGYASNVNKTVLLQGWPASVLQGTKGERNEVALPGDEKRPWWQILMPAYPGVNILTGDFATDEFDRIYVISSPELTDLGWRITASLQGV